MVCFVYVAESAGRVKIGMSNSPRDRMAGLATSTPDDVTLIHQWKLQCRAAAEKMERELHQIFRRSRIRREWFDVSPYDVIGVGDSVVLGDCDEAVHRLRLYRQCAAFRANWERRRNSPRCRRHVARSWRLLATAMERLVLAGLSRNPWDDVFLTPQMLLRGEPLTSQEGDE